MSNFDTDSGQKEKYWSSEYGFGPQLTIRQVGGASLEGRIISDPEFIPRGVEQKYRIQFLPKDVVTPPISLVTKRPISFYPPLNPDETPSQRFEEIWTVARQAGLPVPDLYILSDEVIAFPDLSSDGSVFFGKAAAGQRRDLLHQAANHDRQTSSEVSMLPPDFDFNSVKQAADEIVRKATTAQIRLPRDGALELLIRPDQTWELVILELGTMWYGENAQADPELYPTLEAENRRYANIFLWDLLDILEGQ